MDLDQFDVVQRCIGQTLTPLERCNIECGIIQRRAEEGLDFVQFWGRICGESSDYLFVVALINGNPFPKKKFYFWYVTSYESHPLLTLKVLVPTRFQCYSSFLMQTLRS